MTVTVIGEDGRRIVRGVDGAYGRELAAQIHARTGEQCDVVEDELVVSGIVQPAYTGSDDPTEPEAEYEPKTVRPRRKRTP